MCLNGSYITSKCCLIYPEVISAKRQTSLDITSSERIHLSAQKEDLRNKIYYLKNPLCLYI